MVDLKQLQEQDRSDEGASLELLDPRSDEPIGASLTLLGSDSKAYQDHIAARQMKRLNRQARRARRTDISLTPDELQAETIALLVACTVDWANIEWNGKVLECTPENAEMVYREIKFIRDQASEFIHDRQEFFRQSAEPPKPSGRKSSQDGVPGRERDLEKTTSGTSRQDTWATTGGS